MDTQTVFRLGTRISWDGLIEQKEAIPSVGDHEVLIKVRSISLNFRDVAIATGRYPFPVKELVVPCSDAAGDIVRVGEKVHDLRMGDKVIICFDIATMYGPMTTWSHSLGGPLDGVLREYISVSAHAVVKVSHKSSLSYAQWASVVCTGATVWNAFYGSTCLLPGQIVLFLGTGGVSITGLVMAKAAGAATIITSSSDEKLKYIREKYGVDHCINYKKTPAWGAEVKNITGGRGVDHVLETGGSGTIKQSLEAVAPGGVVSIVGFLSRAPSDKMPDVTTLTMSRGAILRGIRVGSKQLLEQAVQFIGAHNLPIPVEKTFNFNRKDIVQAYTYASSGEHLGKVCINVL